MDEEFPPYSFEDEENEQLAELIEWSHNRTHEKLINLKEDVEEHNDRIDNLEGFRNTLADAREREKEQLERKSLRVEIAERVITGVTSGIMVLLALLGIGVI